MTEEKYEGLLPRFLQYVKTETRSNPDSETVPSDPKETAFLNELKDELIEFGLKDVHINDQSSYVFGTIPSNLDKDVPTIGFLAHVDTADFNAHNVQPQIVEKYDGKSDIVLDADGKYSLTVEEFPNLKNYKGDTLITTDGSTLLGADDKSGVAEIMTMAAYLMTHPEIKHGNIKIGFGPDEEIGTGADNFDVDDFGADFAYTVDGGPLGELEYETFNAAQAEIEIDGKDVHTAVAKGTMINAIQVGINLHNSLPAHERAEETEGREGFFHLYKFNGSVDHASMTYIIRDHDRQIFEERKHLLTRIVEGLNTKLGGERVQMNLYDQYYNLKDALVGKMEAVNVAKEAMKELDIKPVIYPVRGGTDGSTISYKGLPTPNLFAGGENMHSRFEYVSLQTMEKAVDVLLKINELNVKTGK
ncbi:peptidase T [Lactobacillaceae bacterium 24-114]